MSRGSFASKRSRIKLLVKYIHTRGENGFRRPLAEAKCDEKRNRFGIRIANKTGNNGPIIPFPATTAENGVQQNEGSIDGAKRLPVKADQTTNASCRRIRRSNISRSDGTDRWSLHIVGQNRREVTNRSKETGRQNGWNLKKDEKAQNNTRRQVITVSSTLLSDPQG